MSFEATAPISIGYELGLKAIGRTNAPRTIMEVMISNMTRKKFRELLETKGRFSFLFTLVLQQLFYQTTDTI